MTGRRGRSCTRRTRAETPAANTNHCNMTILPCPRRHASPMPSKSCHACRDQFKASVRAHSNSSTIDNYICFPIGCRPWVMTPRYGKEPSESAVRGGADQIRLKADHRSAPLVRQGRDYRIKILDCRLPTVYVRDMFYSGPRDRCVSGEVSAAVAGGRGFLRMRGACMKNDDFCTRKNDPSHQSGNPISCLLLSTCLKTPFQQNQWLSRKDVYFCLLLLPFTFRREGFRFLSMR